MYASTVKTSQNLCSPDPLDGCLESERWCHMSSHFRKLTSSDDVSSVAVEGADKSCNEKRVEWKTNKNTINSSIKALIIKYLKLCINSIFLRTWIYCFDRSLQILKMPRNRLLTGKKWLCIHLCKCGALLKWYHLKINYIWL